MDAPASRGARRLALLTAYGALALLAATLYAALWMPGALALTAMREAPRAATVTWVAPDGPAWSAGVVPGDTIANHPAPGLLVVDHGSHRLVLGPASTRVDPLDLPVSVVGLVVALCGAFVLARGRDRRAAWAFWRMTTPIGLALEGVPAGYHGALWAIALAFVGLALFGPALLALTLVFPSPETLPPRRRVIWAPATVVLLLYLPCWWRPVPLFAPVSAANDALLAGYILVACARLGWVLRQPHSALQRAQLRWLALGLACGFLPLALLNLVPHLLTGRDLAPPQLSVLALALLPVSIGAAIVRAEFLGIPSLIRRRPLRASLSAALLAGIASTTWLLVAAGPERWRWPIAASTASAGLLTAAGFLALRPTLTRWAERLVLHDVYDTGETLHRISGDLVQALPSAVGPLVVTRLSNVLDLTDALLLTPTNQWSYVHPRTTDPVAVQDAIVQRALALFATSAPPEAFVERAAGQPILFLPIHTGPDLRGVLCLGPKRSRDVYTTQDRTLLDTIVRHLALVFSYHHLQEAQVAAGLAPLLLAEQGASPDHAQPALHLSPREMETLRYLAEGLTNKQIAARMYVVEKTVHKHVGAIFDKLDAHTRTEAVAIARRKRLLPPN